MIDNKEEFEKNTKPFGSSGATWKIEKFEIKSEHLKLIQRMNVGWCDAEYGAPEIDPKRPYGNSNVEQDIIEILGFEELKGGIFKFVLLGKEYLLKGTNKYNLDLEDEDELVASLRKLHEETKTALQICLTLRAFETGMFARHEYHNDWIIYKV